MFVFGRGKTPNWIKFQNIGAISNICVVFITGIDRYLFLDSPSTFPTLANRSAFHYINFSVPGSQLRVLDTISCALRTSAKKPDPPTSTPAVSAETSNQTESSNDQTKLQLQFKEIVNNEILIPMLLSPTDLLSNNFPNTISNSNFLDLSPPTPSPPTSPYKLLAIDCEMCLSADGKELARVSIVDESLQVVLDDFVKPDKPIVDYLTQFSGITETTLESVTTKLSDIQSKITQLLTPDVILIGHSLENDLAALQICWPQVIDTSLLYPHRNGLPSKNSLKFLTKVILNKTIQDQQSHCSIEDAKCALELVMTRIVKGPKIWIVPGSDHTPDKNVELLIEGKGFLCEGEAHFYDRVDRAGKKIGIDLIVDVPKQDESGDAAVKRVWNEKLKDKGIMIVIGEKKDKDERNLAVSLMKQLKALGNGEKGDLKDQLINVVRTQREGICFLGVKK